MSKLPLNNIRKRIPSNNQVLKSNFCKPDRPDPAKFSRRRAWVLSLVYLFMAGHFLHWKLAGKTMAPLEFNEATFVSESGLITLGFIFMAIAVISVIAFGRFFCGWACHILALQDLCSALLRKMKIKTNFISSRFLVWIPAAVFFYMFLWPIFKRGVAWLSPELAAWLGGTSHFALRLSDDSSGYASFLTSDLWRNLPGPGLAILTFVVCGFVIVYLLGTRSFCAYVCPYGAMFTWADKLAVGKIKLTGDCHACGKCTASCKSGVDVMTEVRTHGQVISNSCFKDFDCIASCPENALSFGFTLPSVLKPKTTAKPEKKYSFTFKEEVLLLITTAFVLFIFLGLPSGFAPWAGRLYGIAPLLLSVTLAVISGFVVILILRLINKPEVNLHKLRLKKNKLLNSGKLVLAGLLLWMGFLCHSAIIQYHMFRAGYILHSEQSVINSGQNKSSTGYKKSMAAESHLQQAANLLPFFSDARINRQRAWLALNRSDWEFTESLLLNVVHENPQEPDSRFQLGWVMAGRGKTNDALGHLRESETLGAGRKKYQGAIFKAWMQLVHRKLSTQAMELLAVESLSRPNDRVFHREMIELLAGTLKKEIIIYFMQHLLEKNPNHKLAAESIQTYRGYP